MPIVDVSYDATIPQEQLSRLRELLPDVVGEGVGCEEEPWIGPPGKGDLLVRFREKGPLDSVDLDCIIEVRTKLVPSRLIDAQRRSDFMRDRLAGQLHIGEIGVWLVLAEGAWSQS